MIFYNLRACSGYAGLSETLKSFASFLCFFHFRNCVPLLQELIHKCYYDSDPVVKLHTAKVKSFNLDAQNLRTVRPLTSLHIHIV